MRPTPFERLKEDLMGDARRAAIVRDAEAAHAAREAAKPVTQTQISNIHKMIDIVVRTAESCDLDLARHVTTQGHQIKALEEAICPRVAARLQSLETAVRSLQEHRALQGAENREVFERFKGLEKKFEGKIQPAPAAAPHGFMVNGIGYTVEEGRVAAIIADDPIRFQADFKKAREIVDLIRGS